MKTTTDRLKEEAQQAFLRLSPLERMERMHFLFMDIIGVIAKGEGISEYKVYQRYLANNPRHYQRIGRDRKLALILNSPEEIREPAGDLESNEELLSPDKS